MVEPADTAHSNTINTDTVELHDIRINSSQITPIIINPSTLSSNSTDSTTASTFSSPATTAYQSTDNKLLLDDTLYEWNAPDAAANHVYKPHAGENSQYLRDFILGVNDGIISTLLVVLGLYGGGANSAVILLSGISACIAGTIGMGTGEYIATKSQAEVTINDIKLEQTDHFIYHRDVEIQQVTNWFIELGVSGPLLNAVVKQICSDDTKLLQCMKTFEFPSADTIDRNPIRAMLMSGRLFFLGSLPSILPFVQSNTELGLIISCVLCGLCLFIAGAYKTRTTHGNWLYDGMENLLLGTAGASISFGIGYAYTYAADHIG